MIATTSAAKPVDGKLRGSCTWSPRGTRKVWGNMRPKIKVRGHMANFRPFFAHIPPQFSGMRTHFCHKTHKRAELKQTQSSPRLPGLLISIERGFSRALPHPSATPLQRLSTAAPPASTAQQPHATPDPRLCKSHRPTDPPKHHPPASCGPHGSGPGGGGVDQDIS